MNSSWDVICHDHFSWHLGAVNSSLFIANFFDFWVLKMDMSAWIFWGLEFFSDFDFKKRLFVVCLKTLLFSAYK